MHLDLRVRTHRRYARQARPRETRLCFASPYNSIFGYRSVIVQVIVRGHGQETESACAARANVLKKNLSLLRMAGLTAGQPGMVSTMAVLLKVQKKVHTMQNAMQNVHQDDIGCI